MGDEAINEDMRSSYPDIYKKSLPSASDPPFVGSPSIGTVSVM